MTIWVFMELNPINGSLKFRDEDAKSIFIDWALTWRLSTLVEIHQGESISEQQQRQNEDIFNSLPQLLNKNLLNWINYSN